MKRMQLSRQASKGNFTANAVRHHKANFRAAPMRGGIRL